MSQQALFRVIEACLNARRSDRTIIEIPEIDLGRVLPDTMDFLNQNVILNFGSIEFVKPGTNPDHTAASGPVGVGRYYAQLSTSSVTITYTALSTNEFIRSDTFEDGFVFISKDTTEVDRRRLFYRGRLKSSTVGNADPSLWAGALVSIPILNAYLEVDLMVTKNVHRIAINEYSSVGDIHGDIRVDYLSGPPPDPDPLITFPLP